MQADQGSGAQPISKSVDRISTTLKAGDSTSQLLAENGKTTSPISPRAKGATKPPRTGMAATATGGRGVATQSSTPPSVWQADTNLLASLPELLQNSLKSKARHDSDFENVLGYDPIEPKTDESRKMVSVALQALDEALEPASKASIIKALVRLRLSTNSRAQDADDARVQNAIYAEELAEFPCDVIEEALQKLAHLEDWFPPISKVRDQCQRLVHWRRVTRDALARA